MTLPQNLTDKQQRSYKETPTGEIAQIVTGDLSVSIDASDIEIGAVEIKDSSSDNRLVVNSSGEITTNSKQSGAWGISVPHALAISSMPNISVGSLAITSMQDGGNSITIDGGVSATQSGVWNVSIPHSLAISSIPASTTILSNGVAVTSTVSTPVTGTFWQPTQPVALAHSIAVTSIPTTAVSQSGTWTVQVPGNLAVTSIADGGNSITVDGTVAATQSGSWSTSIPHSLAITSMPSTPVTGTFWQTTQPVTLSHSVAVTSVPTTNVATPVGALAITSPSALPVSGTFFQSVQPVILNNAVSVTSMPSTPVTGTFWQTTQPVTLSHSVAVTTMPTTAVSQSGAWTMQVPGNLAITSLADGGNSLTVDAPVATPVFVRLSDGAAAISTLPVSLTSVPSHAVTNAGTFAVQAASAGDVAAAQNDSGNPIKIGGVGKTSNPAAVADGQRVNGLFDKLGKQVVAGSIRDLKGIQQTIITSSISETTIVTAVASTFLDVYGLIITNTSASACKVTIKDATAGTTRAVFNVPAGDTRGFMLPESAAIPQAVVNNNWTATCGTSVTSIEITALYVKNI